MAINFGPVNELFNQEAYEALVQKGIEDGVVQIGKREETEGSDEEVYHYGGRRYMIRNEVRRYREQISQSEGFEVEDFSDRVVMAGAIQNAPWQHNFATYKKCVECVNFAIQTMKANIMFDRIVNVTMEAAGPMNYYITFEARDADDDGKIKTYQTKVCTLIETSPIVEIFRLKPPGLSQDYTSSSHQPMESSYQPMESSYEPMDYEMDECS